MDCNRDTIAEARESGMHDHQLAQYPECAVAVVGVACRFAGVDSPEQLWRTLESGTCHCVDIPPQRFPSTRLEQRPFNCQFRGNILEDIDAFDHRFFNVPSREASFRDPQQRLALEVIYQALESAGHFFQEKTEQQDVGCYIATAMNEYRENIVTHVPSAFSLTGSIRPFIAGQVSHYFGFTGPAIMLDAACAASGVAVNTACRAVASGECTSAIAGATNLLISPDTFQDLACGHFTSATGPSRPFDAAADGYCRGEGVAAIVLKKLSTAVEDGDIIRGVIMSTATNQCTSDSPITVPHAPSQSGLYRKALQKAGLNASQIDYVEAHGTGTRVGDPIEADSIRSVFGTSCDSSKKTYLGSLKSNIGHTEACSGLSGLIKVMMMIEKGWIPQQALFDSLHPEIKPFEPDGLEIPKQNLPWTSSFKAACVNNYGASGCNTVMVVGQPPTPEQLEPKLIERFPISITAFSQASLRSYCTALLDLIRESDLNDDSGGTISPALKIAFHLSRMRNPDLPFAVNTSIANICDLKEFLRSKTSGAVLEESHEKLPSVLFFGGQDGKAVTVSRVFYDSCAILRKYLDSCDATFQTLGVCRILPNLFEPIDSDESTVVMHTKLFSVQYSTAMAWIDCGLRPSRLIGHSFGQLTALCVSGALSLPDALRLVTTRARLIDEMWGPDTGSMIAIDATKDEVHGLMEKHRGLELEVACYNGSRSFVLAGKTSSVDHLQESLKASSELCRHKRLQIRNAFHCMLAEPLVRPLQDVVEKLDLREPKIPLETCSEFGMPAINPSNIALQTREPVYFHHAVQRIADQLGPCVWIEAGSGGNTALLRRALEPNAYGHDVKSVAVDSPRSLEVLSELTADLWKSRLKVQFWPFHHSQQHQYGRVNLPPYQFDKTRHWIEWQDARPQGVVEVNNKVPEPKPAIQLLRRTEDGFAFELDTQSERWQTGCAGNYILKVPVCPPSLLLDILSEAIAMISGCSAQTKRIQRLKNLRTFTPVPANSDAVLSLEIGSTESSHSWAFRVLTSTCPQLEFIAGVVWTGAQESSKEFARFERIIDMARIEAIRRDARSDCIRGKVIYNLSAGLFEIPRSSQIIQELSFNDGEASASLATLSKNPVIAIESLIQIPRICLNSLCEHPHDCMFVATAIEDAHFRTKSDRSIDEFGSYSVYLKIFGYEGVESSCDMYVFDDQSRQLCATLLNVGFTRVPVASFRRALDGDPTASLQTHVSSREILASEPPASYEEYAEATEDLNPHLDHGVLPHMDDMRNLDQGLVDVLVRIADVDPNKMHKSTLLTDLGIDSLMWFEVADEINRDFAVDIDMAEFLVTRDIQSLRQLIENRAQGLSSSSCVTSEVHSRSNRDCNTASSSTSSVGTSVEHEELKDLRATPSPQPCFVQAALEIFDNIRLDFDNLSRETGCETFWTEVHPDQLRSIEAYILEAFTKLGYDLISLKPGEQVPRVDSRRDKLLNRLMLVLQDTGLITKSDDGWIRTDASRSSPPSSASLHTHLLSRFPKWAPEHKLLHLAGSNLSGHLDGTLDPLGVLFGSPEKRQVMADQYLSAPIQSAISRQLATFIESLCRRRITAVDGGAEDRVLRVLEIGGGTCGTTIPVLSALASAGLDGGRIVYTFTDVSPAFVSAAKGKLARWKPFVEFATLDVSARTPEDFRGRFDVVVATNVLHATPRVEASARNVRGMLRPDGIFAMVEYTRAYPLLDVVFGQLEGWWAFEDGRRHAIMDEETWKGTLERAGFSRVEWSGTAKRESEVLRIFLACSIGKGKG